MGCSVSTAGDLNDDGYDDIIVGASGYSGYVGRAHIYFGGPSMDNTADVILSGKSEHDYFGCSVSSAGDFNKDGFNDVIVGSNGCYRSTGRADLYFGSSSMDNLEDVSFLGEQPLSDFGRSVSNAGDLNHDGYDDVIVGAVWYNNYIGRIYIYYGGSPVDNTVDIVITGEQEHDCYGSVVSDAGDVNGDGIKEWIVGAPEAGSNCNGKVYLYTLATHWVYQFPEKGLYMISLPAIPSDSSVGNLFPDALDHAAYEWDPAIEAYKTVEKMEPKKGYWLAIPGAASYTLCGISLDSYSIHFPVQGWYMIGVVSGGTEFSRPNDHPDGRILSPVFGWNVETMTYLTTTDLEETRGYWAAVFGECRLDMHTAGATPPKPGEGADKAEFLEQYEKEPPGPPVIDWAAGKLAPIPKRYGMAQNYPNPFNPETRIAYQIPNAEFVEIDIFDILGRRVARLVKGYQEAGFYEAVWDGRDSNGLSLDSGTYLVRMKAGEFSCIKKMVLMR
jgi:hypothetical protein